MTDMRRQREVADHLERIAQLYEQRAQHTRDLGQKVLEGECDPERALRIERSHLDD